MFEQHFLATRARLARVPVAVATLVITAGCYDQAPVPGDDANDRIRIVNDEFELEQRVDYPDTDVPIEAAFAPASVVAGGPQATGPMLIPRSISLTLKGELEPPVVAGVTVQATMIQPSDGNRAVISYNVRGDTPLGAIDLVQFQGDTPLLKSSAQISDADVNAVSLDEFYAYAAQSSGDQTRPAPAVLERFTVTSNKLELDGLTEAQLTSFATTSAVSTGSVVYATSGNAGAVYALDPNDLSVLAEYALDGARWIALDEANNRVVVAQGEPGRLSVFEAGNFAGGTLNLLNTFTFPGADVAGAKTTVEVHGGKAFVAAGPEGVQIVCLDNGQIVGSIPRPDPGELGLDPSVVVTNSVTVDRAVLFISNGEAGVYAAAADSDFASTSCTDSQAITVLGRLKFDDLQSANHVVTGSSRLYVAAGLGGVKVLKVQIRN